MPKTDERRVNRLGPKIEGTVLFVLQWSAAVAFISTGTLFANQRPGLGVVALLAGTLFRALHEIGIINRATRKDQSHE